MLKYFIETFGCQMNDRDSEIMAQLLSHSYSPALLVDDADVVLVNTCSIRQKAEQKAFSLLGRLKLIKRKRPGLIIAVVGCVAQQEGEKILERMPYVDLVMGTQNIYNLPTLLAEIACDRKRLVAIEQSSSFVIPPFLPDAKQDLGHKRFITIMQGCNNFCTYCVVPFTRGREVSRLFDEIVTEARHLVDNGVKEITLLGQNVNSYGRDQKGKKIHTFSELLRAVADIRGLKRLRFTSSNPHDLSDELITCFTDLDVLCSHFHLPVQSGSDAVLKAMNRKYTRKSYLELVTKLQQARPGIAITTDLIVGFPGETSLDFEDTMSLVKEVRYHSAFSFRYSDRPHAKSADFPDKLPEELKQERLALLQTLINDITYERHLDYLNTIELVMVEGRNRNRADQWSGRTGSNHMVNFTSSRDNLQPGEIVDVSIKEACQHSLRGVQNIKEQKGD